MARKRSTRRTFEAQAKKAAVGWLGRRYEEAGEATKGFLSAAKRNAFFRDDGSAKRVSFNFEVWGFDGGETHGKRSTRK